MIEEIIKLREDGLSFRKIASQLNTTVGRVQYRWNKYVNSIQPIENDGYTTTENLCPSENQSAQEHEPEKGELQIKLISPRKIALFWESSKIPKGIIRLFFNREFDELVQVVRIYDVTDIMFNGQNAHHFYEIPISYTEGYWFVKGLVSNRSYLAELGVKFQENDFFPLLRSDALQTPVAEIGLEHHIYHDLMQFHQLEDKPSAWDKQVSTYSFYGESKALEEQNG